MFSKRGSNLVFNWYSLWQLKMCVAKEEEEKKEEEQEEKRTIRPCYCQKLKSRLRQKKQRGGPNSTLECDVF
jgi:hypothetical protein